MRVKESVREKRVRASEGVSGGRREVDRERERESEEREREMVVVVWVARERG